MIRAGAIAASALLLSACAPHPERACVAPGTDATVLSMIYGTVGRIVDGQEWSAAGSPVTKAKLHLAVAALSKTGFATLSHTALEGYDKTTRRATCSTEVHVHLTPLDKAPARREAVQRIGLGGFELPSDLYAPDPYENFVFTSQPKAAGDGTQVGLVAPPETVLSILTIAIARVEEPAKTP